MRSGPWELKNMFSRKKVWSKNDTSFGFDAVLKSTTDEKWSLGAKKNVSRTHFWPKNCILTFGFDAVLKLKTDEKWSLGAQIIKIRGKYARRKMTLFI